MTPKVQIERTSKPLKLALGFFTLGIVASVMVMLVGEGTIRAAGVFVFLGSIVGLIVTRFVRWWQHG